MSKKMRYFTHTHISFKTKKTFKIIVRNFHLLTLYKRSSIKHIFIDNTSCKHITKLNINSSSVLCLFGKRRKQSSVLNIISILNTNIMAKEPRKRYDIV